MDGDWATRRPTWVEWVAGVIGFSVMFGIVTLAGSSLSLKLLSGAGAGLVVGLISNLQAKRRGADRVGIYSIAACALAGSAGGVILALPTCIVFIWYIRRTYAPARSTPLKQRLP